MVKKNARAHGHNALSEQTELDRPQMLNRDGPKMAPERELGKSGKWLRSILPKQVNTRRRHPRDKRVVMIRSATWPGSGPALVSVLVKESGRGATSARSDRPDRRAGRGRRLNLAASPSPCPKTPRSVNIL